ncbi:MAG: RNB domain-containing ribonuclease [Opitutales bacterium]|nr:RNB domain-containing ribonuclease [Opitutales bacterium]
MLYLPRLISLLKDRTYIPLPIERLAEKLEVGEDEFADFKNEVQQHLRQGTLVKLKKNRICLPRDADLVTGIIQFRQSGSALLRPDPGPDGKPVDPLEINAEDTWVAMHRDRVVCRIHHDRRQFHRQQRGGRGGSDSQQARVIRILERANETLAGTLKLSHMFYFVIPDNPRIIQDILVPDPKDCKLDVKPKIDDKVVVRLQPWEQRHLNPEGDIVEVLGRTHTPDAEYKAIFHQYSLNPEFPQPVLDEIRDLPKTVPAEQSKGRVDLRDQWVMTIDPQDAKDFDDALSIEPTKDGGWKVGIHIADVSSYVRPGTALDDEARNRGNSTYLVGKVIPMLPHELSNGLCSLVEGEDRLTKSVFITYNKGYSPVKAEFAETVIRSKKRLTYEQAYAFMFEDDHKKIRNLPEPPKHQTGATGRSLKDLSAEEMKEIQTRLRQMWAIAEKIRGKRMRGGSLDLDMPETKIYVDEDGYADRIVKIENDESHQMIEEFMLAANEAVAKTLNDRNLPGIHRVHDKPDAAKLDELGEHLASMGIHVGDLSVRREMTEALKQIRKHPLSHILRIQVLRSLKAACYRASPDGHYGLNKKHYAHFTSPIRRYADLIVHRLFARHLIQPGDKNMPNYKTSDLTAWAQHISITEQNSTEAERESNKLKLMEFFERELEKDQKTSFDAVVMDIRNHGMFVELSESMAYGLVHISTLRDDLYKVNQDLTQLVGRRTRRKFTVGQTIQVQVARVDRFKRQIDFMVADKPKTKKQTKKKQRPKK